MAEIGRMVGGRYKLVELLGEGGFATVYRAADTQANREVAVKVLRPEYAADPDFMSDFRWQSRVAANLDHENIARVLGFGTDRGGTYLVTEYIDGADLATLLERNGPVPPRRAARAAAEVGRALQAGHDRGLPHGDLQPGNVMVTRDGHVKVTDFGVARAAAAVNDATTANIKRTDDSPPPVPGRGTGPKVVAAPSEAADVEALGFLLYEMLTGRAPWVGESVPAVLAARKAGPPPRPSTLNPAVPVALDEITMRALSPVADWRYASAAQVADELETFVDGGEAVTIAAPPAAIPFVPAPMPLPSLPPIPPVAPISVPAGGRVAARSGHSPYSEDAYATAPIVAPVPFDDFESDDDSDDPYELRSGRARRQARRSGRMDDDAERTGTSPWAWVAGVLGILMIAIIAVIVFLLFNGSKPEAAPFQAPSLLTLTYTQAQQIATADGINLSPVFQANTGNQTENTIVAQDPTSGAPIHKGDTITVTIVTGVGTVMVPNITGMTETDAKAALVSAGLQLGSSTEEYDPSVPAGDVVSSNPSAGIAVQYGTSVNYVLSKGPAPSPSASPSASPSPTPTPTPTPTPPPTPTPTPTPPPSTGP